MRSPIAGSVLAIGMLLAACTGGDSGNSSAGPPDEGDESSDTDSRNGAGARGDAAPGGGCSVTVSGDVSLTWTDDYSGQSVGSDYWTSEEGLRSTYQMFQSEDDPPFEEARASGEPILSILTLNCVDGSNILSLMASDGATFDDIPQGPGSYPIGEMTLWGETPSDVNFVALLTLDLDEELAFRVDDAGGMLDIEEWTDDRLSGTFTFGIEESFAQDPPRTGTVTGSFDFGP